MLASNVLVQLPATTFEQLGRVLMWATTFLTFVDLDFDLGPILLYSLFVLGDVSLMIYLKLRRNRRTAEAMAANAAAGNARW